MTSEQGVTTSHQLVRALVRYLRAEKKDVDLFVVESDHPVATADEEFHRLGYLDLAQEGARLVNLSSQKKLRICFDGWHLKSLDIPELMLNCTKFISVAKLKTHDAEKMSCVLKNEFGMMTERYGRAKYHPFLSEVLADLNDLYRGDLFIVDGDWALEGKGPSEGEARKVGMIICGRDPVATDIVAARMMGLNPLSVPHLRYCMKHLDGVKNSGDIQVVGDKFDPVRFKSIPLPYYFAIRVNFAVARWSAFSGRVIAKFFGLLLKPGLYYSAYKMYTLPDRKQVASERLKNIICGRIGSIWVWLRWRCLSNL